MTERVPCATCGAKILAETAVKNGGLCMPCKGGYREGINESRRFYEKQKKLKENPATKHWGWLVTQVYEGLGFEGVSSANQYYFAVRQLDREVYNGGFDQYFTNTSADFYIFALEGLAEMEAVESYRLLKLAKQLYFGADQIPGTQASRLQYLDTNPVPGDQVKRIEELDRQFCIYPDMLQGRLTNYAMRHGLYSNFTVG